MKNFQLGTCITLLLLMHICSVGAAEEEPLAGRLLGSPLLILMAIIVIDIIAFIYHRIRR